jgi:hypothetical protein
MTIQEVREGIQSWKLTKERKINFSIGIAALLIYEFAARPFYRPYIYKNQINDLHIADTLGNSLGTIATIFILIGFFGQGKTQQLFLIKTIVLSLVLFELSHPLLGKPIDPLDIAATLVTGSISYIAYKILIR